MWNTSRFLLSSQVLLILAAIFVGNASACKKVTRPIKKLFANPKVTEVDGHTCYTQESIRIDEGVAAFTNDNMDKDLSLAECKKFCKESGFEGKIVGLTPTECHCNKYMKYDGKRDKEKCPIRCKGNDQDYCGGIGYISVYPS
ncbi:hypothetical protein BOX15_Mlig020127g1 [Macrostomum lignano]|uniref:WSC domain-containing protein n=2 Tax=Macrostomum lignano TaxID=282301 RepID=A0A1I8GC79_9PLAT|nr:hypothetical protein BOX15_Mlig020127g2 [Macrostomum lignano]PAA72086.1 hypothetical protein BOX15_Mlig020127g1 [Macrostomum lignano]